MSRLLRNINKGSRLGLLTAALSMAVVAGCSSGPSQKEMDALGQQRQAMDAAEGKVAKLKAEKAALERDLADKKAEKKDLAAKKAAARENLVESTAE